LFKLTEQALKGEPVSFVYKGTVFRLVPEGKASKLSKLTPQPVVAQRGLDSAGREMLQEMEKEWEQDWAEL
jgi:hypothetical protein